METGSLLSFEIQPNGDVILGVSDIEDQYVHHITLTAQELAGIAEASAVRRSTVSRITADTPAQAWLAWGGG